MGIRDCIHRVWGIVKHNFSTSLTPWLRSLPFPSLEIVKGGSCNLLLNFHSYVPFSLYVTNNYCQSCFLGYIIFHRLLQIVILLLLLTTFFPCFLGYIFFPCLLQIAILPFLLTNFFPCFLGYSIFSCMLQIIILAFSTTPFSLHLTNYNLKLGQPHANTIKLEL